MENLFNRYVMTTILLAGTAVALLALDLSGTVEIRALFAGAATPAVRVSALVWELEQGRRERAALAERLARRSLLLGRADAYKRENDALRAQLRLALAVPYDLAYAPVVEKRTESWLKTISLGAGRRDGVTPGMAVVGTEGLVGRVVRVTAGAAEVELITSERARIGVTHAPSGEGAVYYADAAGNGRLQYLPRATRLAYGDAITTSQGSGLYPPGLIVGYVRSYRRPFNSMFADVTVAPAESFDALESVFVVKWRPPSAPVLKKK